MYRVVRSSDDFEGMDKYDKRQFARRTSDPNVLENLASDKDYNVRAAVAFNENTPNRILEKLAEDEEDFVRETVASNENTSNDALEKLADDISWRVRLNVAKNINTSPSILEYLAEEGGQVGKCAMETLKYDES